jgi:hypothetical protein
MEQEFMPKLSCAPIHCKSVPAQSQIWHTMWQSCLKWRTISHMWSRFCFTRVKYASIFLTHGVPNTPQVKPTEDNCGAYFTQHVSNVTLCRCQIYSVDVKTGSSDPSCQGSRICFYANCHIAFLGNRVLADRGKHCLTCHSGKQTSIFTLVYCRNYCMMGLNPW